MTITLEKVLEKLLQAVITQYITWGILFWQTWPFGDGFWNKVESLTFTEKTSILILFSVRAIYNTIYNKTKGD